MEEIKNHLQQDRLDARRLKDQKLDKINDGHRELFREHKPVPNLNGNRQARRAAKVAEKQRV